MAKCIPVVVAIVVILGIIALGCDEPLVGAPCKPETDKGDFTPSLTNDTYSVETRSVQCETSVCITLTHVPPEATPDMTQETEYLQYEGMQEKFSFCSCRCKTASGETYDRNDDALDDLCTCPGSSICDMVLPDTIEGVAENIAGYYCIPDCILTGCEGEQSDDDLTCQPSTNDETPWAWSCQADAS